MRRVLLLLLFCCFVLRSFAQITWESPCTDKIFCFDPGNCSGGTVTLWEAAATNCGSPTINFSYKIDLGNNGSIDIQSSDDTINQVLPAGTHQIIWRAQDNCGNVSQGGCTYLITVKDCNPPNLLCINGLAQNLVAPDCAVVFDVQDFILQVNDNCTPLHALDFGIRLTGNGMGFPSDTSLSFGICDQGYFPVQIWARDENGLSNACNSYVLVQENAGLCICNEYADIRLEGCARTADSTRLDAYRIRATLQGTPIQGAPISQIIEQDIQDSCFSLAFADLPLNGSYIGSVRAGRFGGDPLEGVSTFDLVLINRHILGQQPLENFYQVLASDVNQSNSISTFDIIEIRKLILGIYDSFPQTTSWRFVRPAPDPLNLAAFAEVRDTYPFAVPNLLNDTVFSRLDFVGIKMGDANANAALHEPAADDRAAPLVLRADDPLLEIGEEAWITFRLSEAAELYGWQMALQADAAFLEIQDVQGVSPQGVALTPAGALRIACLADAPDRFAAGDALFSVRVLARQSGRVSGGLRVSGAPLAPEAYTSGAAAGVRSLEVWPEQPTAGAVFHAPQPNPFFGETTFGLELPASQEVLLEVFDLTGRRVYRAVRQLEAGRQEWVFPGGQLLPAGVFAWRIQVGREVWSGRLVRR
ncbi:MAG: hypothetical protein IPM98_04965 [Lewinellaceae bacterium]|nr:hypothetical protein [Lewinellaceae bacterium]